MKLRELWAALAKPEYRSLKRLLALIVAGALCVGLSIVFIKVPLQAVLILVAAIVSFGLVFLFEVWDVLRDRFTNLLKSSGNKETGEVRRTTWFFSIVIIAGLVAATFYQTCCDTCDPTPVSSVTNAPSATNGALLAVTNGHGTNLQNTQAALVSGSTTSAFQSSDSVAQTNATVFRKAAESQPRKSRRAQHTVTIFLWSLACLACGSLTGFLFGIPKVLQSGGRRKDTKDEKSRSEAEADEYRQQVNTNLTEISDWITKIIVGLGLINLKVIPGKIHEAAGILAQGLQGCGMKDEHIAFAVAVILFFTSIGFLFGYLMTRLFLAVAFSRADVGAFNTAQRADSAVVASLADAFSVLRKEVVPQPAAIAPPPAATQPPASSQPVTPQVPGQPAIVATPQIPLEQAPPPPTSTPPPSEPGRTPLPPSFDPESVLAQLVQRYNTFESPDYEERVTVRDQLAEDMAVLLNRYNHLRNFAFLKASSTGDNGFVAGLATAINAQPLAGDLGVLLGLGPLVRYKHSKYKVVTAIGSLFRSRMASKRDVPAVTSLLSQYYAGDSDDSLRQRIREVAALISRATGMGIALPPT